MTWQNSKSIRYKNNPISNKNIHIRDMTNQANLEITFKKLFLKLLRILTFTTRIVLLLIGWKSEEIRIEHLSQKVLKQAEKILSRHEYWKIIDHVHKLEGQEKNFFSNN